MGFPGAEVIYPVYVEVQARAQDVAVNDWITWQNQVSPITVITTLGLVVSLGMWIFRVGGKNNEIESTKKGLDDLRKKVEAMSDARSAEREHERKEREAFQVAMNAGMLATGGVIAEFKEHSARSFATKTEMAALEDRTNRGMDRIVDRLEQISGRLENIGDGILKALASKH
jgi:hypothetical protein